MVPPDPVSGEGFLPASKMACLAISSHLGGVDTCPNSKKSGGSHKPSDVHKGTDLTPEGRDFLAG